MLAYCKSEAPRLHGRIPGGAEIAVIALSRAPQKEGAMPKRLVKFVLRRSGSFFRALICAMRIRFFGKDHPWQEVTLGDDSGLHKARICGFCKKEEISDAGPDDGAEATDMKIKNETGAACREETP